MIGKELGHSFSANYFKNKFEIEQISDCIYRNFPLKRVEEILELIEKYSPEGLNVTIPYKEKVLPFLDKLSPDAKAIGAVNCISFNKGLLIGHNTDVIGFEKSLRPLLSIGHSNAIVLGTGGAAKAVVFVLRKLGIDFRLVSTQDKDGVMTYNQAEKQLQDFPLIINTTPVGTFPNSGDCPLSNLNGIGVNHLVYDLIYNPEKTCLLSQAEGRGAQIKNGLEMLEIQAEESWKIWTTYA